MNRKLILSAALSGLMLTATAQTTVAPAIPRDGKIEKKVEALLKKMTLEEKIGHFSQNGDCHPIWSPDRRSPVHE